MTGSVAHCPLRNDDQSPSSAPTQFARLIEGICQHWPRMICRSRPADVQARARPAIASLAIESNSFPTRVYEHSLDLVDWPASEMQKYDVKPEIEAFDLGHIFQAVKMNRNGRLKAPPYVRFAMGFRHAMPAERPSFEFHVETLKRIAPDAQWCDAGTRRHQIEVNECSIPLGGHTRTGREDHVGPDRDRLAPSNAALVRRTTQLCARHGRLEVGPIEARATLGRPPAPRRGFEPAPRAGYAEGVLSCGSPPCPSPRPVFRSSSSS
ncbi:3-keto-5-aminohexanoate cleavage protein [Rhodovulum sulfidophilum]|uniref:3-keto-5-aminohexanoate cleavage protein n=1 Tax=Rhodovulum sulfidophilum TaxID=35806 RepID=UPI003075C43B